MYKTTVESNVLSVSGSVVWSLHPIDSSAGLRPHQGKGVE